MTEESMISAELSLSMNECSTSPPNQPFSNLIQAFNSTEWNSREPMTMSIDPYPNDIAVSCYASSTPGVVLGSITGSATARQTTVGGLFETERFTPTMTVVGTPTSWKNIPFTDVAVVSVSVSSGSGSGSEASGSASGSAETSKAGVGRVVRGEMKVTTVVVVVVVGLLMVV